MSSNTMQMPVAECDLVDTEVDAKPSPIQLCQFLRKEAESPLWCIDRTARYAKDPIAYLKQTLGEELFEKRQPQMCVPELIDRDVYGTGVHKQHFEQRIAKILGKEHGLFYITGVQAQLNALRVHCEQVGNYRVAWHISSHLESAEENAYKSLYGLNRILLGDDPEENPSVEEIEKLLARPESCRPAAIVLEIPNRTLACKTYSFEDLQTIHEACRNANVRLHCDGARLWEIEPYYQETSDKSFAEICALFDSVYVSFYKGLGGSAGAILACNDLEVINQAKKWQRRAGGNVYTLFYQVIDAERGFNENIGAFASRRREMIEIANKIKEATQQYRTEDGLPFVQFGADPPTCCQTHTTFQGFSADDFMAARDRVEEKTNIRVFNKLRPKQTLDEILEGERAAKAPAESTNSSASVDRRHMIEWMTGAPTEEIDIAVFVEGYVALCKELELHGPSTVQESTGPVRTE